VLIVDGIFNENKLSGGSVDEVIAWAKSIVGKK
jgi:hypothetical protein